MKMKAMIMPCFYRIRTQSNDPHFDFWCGRNFSQSTRAVSVGGGNEELRKLDIQVCRKARKTNTEVEEMKVTVLGFTRLRNAYRVSQFPETCMKK